MEEKQHARLAPSSSARWVNCPASVPFTKDMKPAPATKYTQEGTYAHRLAELALKGEELPDEERQEIEIAGYDIKDFEIAPYVEYVRGVAGDEPIMVEVPLDIEPITHEAGATGTADSVVVRDGVMYVCDLKYGMGEKVEAEENTQLLIYAGAAYAGVSLLYTDIKEVQMCIIQPRLQHVSEWRISLKDLGKKLDVISAAATEALKELKGRPKTWKFNPSRKACRWCPARGNCMALSRHCLSVAGFDLLDDTMKPGLSPEHIGSILANLDLIAKWAEAVKDKASEMLRDGDEIPGWKLVMGKRGNRAWTSDKDAEAVLSAVGDAAYTRQLITPTAAEKLKKSGVIASKMWDDLQSLITRAPASPTLAPASDKRQAWAPCDAADFPNELNKD